MKRRLSLNRETLRQLSPGTLGAARGGSNIIEPTAYTYCLQCGSGGGGGTGSDPSVAGPCTIDWTNCNCWME